MASTTPAAPKERLITADEFLRMPDTDHCELVAGRIVRMTPPPDFEHGEVELNVAVELRAFVRAHQLGRVAVGEVSIYTGRDPDHIRGADVAFISNERDARRKERGPLEVGPDLVVEILSPSNSMSAMLRKLREYFAIGVRLVWLVDPENRSVLAYRSMTDVRQFGVEDHIPGDDVLPGFSVPVARFFE